MAAKNANDSMPPGFEEMVQSFTIATAKASPTNLHQFAVDYFTKLRDTQPLRAISEDDETAQRHGVRFKETDTAAGLTPEKQAGKYKLYQNHTDKVNLTGKKSDINIAKINKLLIDVRLEVN